MLRTHRTFGLALAGLALTLDSGTRAQAPEGAGGLSAAVDAAPRSPLAALPSLLSREGILRFARMTQRGTAPEVVPWTVTAATDGTETYLCFEGAPPLPRCFTIAAGAESFMMPPEPRSGFPLRVGIGVQVAAGDVEELMFQLDAPGADPSVALSNFVGTTRAGARLPSIYAREVVPALVREVGDVEAIERQGGVLYATSGGFLSACERGSAGFACTEAVKVAEPADVLVLEPDAQGPTVYELEVEVYSGAGQIADDRIHVAVFSRAASGRLELGAVIPFGGERAVTGPEGRDISEVLYEELEAVGSDCIRIGRPELEHRLEQPGGAERRLAGLRLVRAPARLPATAWQGDSLLVDSSGFWQLQPGGGASRVARCPAR